MGKGKVVDTKPRVIALEPGNYSWCSCGESADEPFCDGAHKELDSELGPVRFTLEEAKTVALCLCKQTDNRPFCDGSHAKL